MRLSIIPGDPGYDVRKAARHAVYLDGELMPFVQTADEEAGRIWLFIPPDTETLHELIGKVELKEVA